ncbi:NAD(P)/FAD-dependent oxidoreductase [Streptomyces sp. AJS327]|uniref:phytoene desaturase family protein n=1 Tax=Streptomyces sp. AJS327 TaxID=2545265 RepID=UPI0015DFA726|nr:NAD(P)/FAD-dependent oxidoreductase [Streptomyces sp. AJS327]MBA0050316.1 NAD(P)/FAD-dependent oxidoreductase [Streptomyces sp. AJS327]
MARIAVIGAGMGAMAAAARLATAGHSVSVYERTGDYGGAVRRYARKGFGFDTGPGLLRLPAVYRDLFLKTGREPLEECVDLVQLDPAVRHVLADGTSVTLPGTSRGRLTDALDTAFGAGSGERWAELLNRAGTAWEASRRPLLEEPLPVGRAAEGAAPGREDPYPATRRRGLLRRRAPTLAELAADELGDERLATLLESHARELGLDPATAPGSTAVLAYLDDAFGCWYVRGGMRRLADAVHERCRARGVTFHFGREVSRVVERDGRAAGVELKDPEGRGGDETVAADVVVASGPPERWAGAGRDAGRRSRSVSDGAQPEGWLSGRFTVLVALRGARPEGTPHRTVVHEPDLPGRQLTVLRPDDPASRPGPAYESAVLRVTLPTPGAGMPGHSAEDAEELAGQLLSAADEAGLGLRGRRLWHEVRTPRENEEETGAPGGAVPAPALAGARGGLLRPANQSELPGLYRVGGWAHPGGGLAHAGMSGALVAGLITEGDDWRGSA